MEKTIEIPEGYEARIEDNKVILEPKESEDERIRKSIESIIRVYGKTQGEWIAGYDMDTLVVHLRDAFACLERQKEQKPLPPANSGARYYFDEWIKQQPTPKYWDAFLAGIDFNKKEQGPMHFLGIPAGDIAPAEEDGPFDEDEFLDGELSAFLQNYDKEYDDDAAVSDVARHFYEIGKKQKEQKPASGNSEKPNNHAEWSEDWREEDIQTRFAFYTYKDDTSVLYLSNVFVEETSRNHGFGTKILRAAEKVAETIGATTISLKVKQDSPANAWYRKNGYGYMAFEDGYDWLEKNLEYMKPNKQDWSEEDEKFFKTALWHISYSVSNGKTTDDHCDTTHWLKGVKERLKTLCPSWKPAEQLGGTFTSYDMAKTFTEGQNYVIAHPEKFGLCKPAEWEEEDAGMLNCIIATLCEESHGGRETNDKMVTWLENRFKSLHPQPHWKPSEEQMEVDLEKFTEKIKTFQGRYKYPEIVSIKGAMAFMARMFYQYPNVARQWYDSLPKATMD